jgi:hypothetical protein
LRASLVHRVERALLKIAARAPDCYVIVAIHAADDVLYNAGVFFCGNWSMNTIKVRTITEF